MTRISLDAQAEEVKQFVLSLPADPNGSVLELNGRVVAHVTHVASGEEAGSIAGGDWTEAKNARRCTLIDKEIAGRLSPQEAAELGDLQQAMLRYRRQVAPLPLEEARRLHQQLLTQARKGTSGG
jgi:hypothetical protein